MKYGKIIILIFLFLIMILVWVRSCAFVAKKYGGSQPAERKAALKTPSTVAVPLSGAVKPQPPIVSQVKPKTQYTEWGRSPFILQRTRKYGANLNIAGILWDKNNPQAIINGQVVGRGDVLEGFKVIEITKDKVILSDGANQVELRL